MNNLKQNGIEIINNFFEENDLEIINSKLYNILEIKNKKFKRNDNCLHHILVYDKFFFLDILKKISSINCINEFFKNKFILHSFGGVINKPNTKHYTHNFHIDSPEENTSLMLNILIPMHDFTIENGCTKIYLKGQNTPTDIILKKGDILIFDSSLVHSTGNNTTNFDRNCLTITLTKVYCKPQFNYKILYNQNELDKLDNKIKDILNINSQIYENLEDFYNKKYFLK